MTKDPALDSPSPAARRVAAIALGKRGGADAVARLRQALERETVAWVRPSIVLAIGKIGGDAARDALAGVTPMSEAEAEALRKARDRVAEPVSGFAWRDDVRGLYAAAPRELEDVAASETGGRVVRPGLIELPRRGAWRCIYDTRLLVGEGAPGDYIGTVRAADVRWREAISGGETLPYRFSLENARVTKADFDALLRAARETFASQQMVDSPSRYAAMLRVEADEDATRVWLVPTFERDERFAYRHSDVGASINPAVGACLARLVRRGAAGAVVDPTCGSGTLLIERAKLDDAISLAGIDVSPTAIRAATQNIIAAGLAHRIAVRQGDGGDAASWPERCDEVLANLPFGVRTEARNLDGLYRRLVGNIARTLAPGGRALLYTSHAKTLVALFRRTPQLRVIGERTVDSGGIRVGLWLLEKR